MVNAPKEVPELVRTVVLYVVPEVMLLWSVIDTPLHLAALLATAGGEKNITVYPMLVEGIDLVYVPFDICTGNLVA